MIFFLPFLFLFLIFSSAHKTQGEIECEKWMANHVYHEEKYKQVASIINGDGKKEELKGVSSSTKGYIVYKIYNSGTLPINLNSFEAGFEKIQNGYWTDEYGKKVEIIDGCKYN